MNAEDYVKAVLKEAFGFKVEKISESESRTADFLVSDGEVRYLIEVKSREDDPEVIDRMQKDLDSKGATDFEDTAGRKNRLSGLIRDGVDQLAQTALDAEYRLLWLVGVGKHQQNSREQFEATLYGTRTIFDLECTHTYPCYFYDHNEFFPLRADLDGAVASTMEEGKFCLNPYSEKYASLKETALVTRFGTGVVDPSAEEEKDKAMILDAAIDRDNDSVRIAFLNKKYQRLKITPMQMQFMSHSIRMDASDGV